MNNQSIVWWRSKNLIVMNNDVRPDFRSYFSYNSESGNLKILKANFSGSYQCGVKFSNQKHRFYITVIGKCLSLLFGVSYGRNLPYFNAGYSFY